MNAVFVANLAVAWFLTGLIWTIQVVHYPLFSFVGDRFCDYEDRHKRRIGYIVGPTMSIELVAAALLVWRRPSFVEPWIAATSLGLVVLIWISTAALQAPCHAKLSQGFDAAVERRLTMTNWIRTAAWTIRASLLSAALVDALR